MPTREEAASSQCGEADPKFSSARQEFVVVRSRLSELECDENAHAFPFFAREVDRPAP
jgi:hypothetical protein